MKTLVETVVEWTKEKEENLDINDKRSYLKAFGLGVIKGYADAAILMYPVTLFAAYYWQHKATKK